VTDSFQRLEPRQRLWLLLGEALLLNALMAMSLGAKYWFDSISYFQLATAILDPSALQALYSGRFGIIYQHVMPGLPFLIAVFERIFGAALWPAFAMMQYGLSALASVYFTRSFQGRLSWPGQLALVFLISTFPFFSAFHGAILTESLSSTLLLLIAAIAIRCLDGRIRLGCALAMILLLGIAGGQLRSYLAAYGGGCAFLIIFNERRLMAVHLYGAAVAAVAFGFFAYPAYRAACGAEFYPPNVNSWMLTHVSYVVQTFDARSAKAIDGVVLDPLIKDKLVSSGKRLDTNDTLKIVDDLVAAGATRREAGKRIADAAFIVRTQSLADMETQLQLALGSLGFQHLATCCDPNRPLTRGGFTGVRSLGHLQYYYRWNAGLSADDYKTVFDSYPDRALSIPGLFTKAAVDWHAARVGPYVRAQPSAMRSVVGWQTALPADILIVIGMLGFAMLVRWDWRFVSLLAMAMGLVYLAAVTATVVGDNRHAHLLWPFYLCGITGFGEWALRVIRTRYGAAMRLPQ
jgi:hypothetical protein